MGDSRLQKKKWRLDNIGYLISSSEMRNIFDAFNRDTDKLEFTRPVPEFDVSKLLKAAKQISLEKACGSSGIPNEILKRIVIARPQDTVKIYNKCLKSLSFRANWKKPNWFFFTRVRVNRSNFRLTSTRSVFWTPLPVSSWKDLFCKDLSPI